MIGLGSAILFWKDLYGSREARIARGIAGLFLVGLIIWLVVLVMLPFIAAFSVPPEEMDEAIKTISMLRSSYAIGGITFLQAVSSVLGFLLSEWQEKGRREAFSKENIIIISRAFITMGILLFPLALAFSPLYSSFKSLWVVSFLLILMSVPGLMMKNKRSET